MPVPYASEDPFLERLRESTQRIRQPQLTPFQQPQPVEFSPKVPQLTPDRRQISPSIQQRQPQESQQYNIDQPGLMTQVVTEQLESREPIQPNRSLPPSLASLAQKYDMLNYAPPTGNDISAPYQRQLNILEGTRRETELAGEARANYKRLEQQVYSQMQNASMQSNITYGGTILSPAAQKQADSIGQKILRAGERYIGRPYVFGGLDCSKLVQAAYSQVGIKLPRVSYQQARSGKALPFSQARPGDIVVMNSTLGANRHVAIYAGGGKLLEAPRTGKLVGYYPIGNRHVNFVVRPY